MNDLNLARKREDYIIINWFWNIVYEKMFLRLLYNIKKELQAILHLHGFLRLWKNSQLSRNHVDRWVIWYQKLKNGTKTFYRIAKKLYHEFRICFIKKSHGHMPVENLTNSTDQLSVWLQKLEMYVTIYKTLKHILYEWTWPALIFFC